MPTSVQEAKPSGKKLQVIRLFVALDLPSAIKDQCRKIMQSMIGVSWLPDNQIHLTVRFIGEVKSGKAPEIQTVLKEVQSRPFKLNFSGVGCYPPRGTPKVLWAGVTGETVELAQLHKEIEKSLETIGIKAEQRFFRPHVTIGRTKNASRKSMMTWIADNQRFRTSEFKVTRFGLYSSIVKPTGATHQREAQYNLSESYL